MVSESSQTFPLNLKKEKTNLIIGQSGSGKTVLLKCILGLYGIDSGNIYFEERSFQNMNILERR